MIITLEDALATGRGVERPFTCPVGDHRHPTASVNVVKGVWFCYSCHAKGGVDSKRVPTDAELEAMLEPEEAVRVYPDSFLTVFGVGGYWADRFPEWLCWYLGFGQDPWSGEGTYPVHTPGGQFAGVCRRSLTEGPWPKYKYPRVWSASRSLFGSRGRWRPTPVLMLTEGAADAAAGREVGVPSFATYGSGVHAPQVELIAAMQPSCILLGFDNDEAGNRAAEAAVPMLEHLGEVVRVDWKEFKDPAEVPVEERLRLITERLPFRHYDAMREWERWTEATRKAYEEETAA